MRVEFYNTKEYGLDLNMVTCGYEDCIPHFVCAPHFRNFHLIHYVVKGTGFYEVNGTKYPVKQGEIFIIRPGEPISYSCPDGDHPWSLYWMGFSGPSAENYFSRLGFSDYVVPIEGNGFGSAVMRCLSYVKENEGNIAVLRLSAYVLEALYGLMSETKPCRLRPAERVGQALKYIEYNYMHAISPRDVAEHLSLERSYFYRIFKNHVGMSPEQYIIRYRIQKAADLIRLNRYSISEIAVFVGIRDIFYFSRLFKSITGLSPREYEGLPKEGAETVSDGEAVATEHADGTVILI